LLIYRLLYPMHTERTYWWPWYGRLLA